MTKRRIKTVVWPPKATHIIRNGWAKTQLGLYGQLIEMIPVVWLDKLNNLHPSPMTNLFGSDKLVSLADLWKNIQEIGMQDPILLHVCQVSGFARVEAGNQRIEIARLMGESHLPAVCLISAKKMLHPGNGTHVFDLRSDLCIPLCRATQVVERLTAPSSVFR